ncbi:hypothetical protein [Bacillus thuringiensis]|uniref:hypothetical protein n=1 Tax=Bacillus thuringiensis TaxID=1428 RepID=UPI001144D6DB|nr:hypothetical protein [Bacillus thuringiensis]
MKRALFFFISIFFLGSCSISYVNFSSESKSWTGQYKGGDGKTEFKNLEIAINGAFSTMTQTSEVHKGARVEIKSSCVSCAPLSKDEPIEVVIKWDDKYEEKMVLNLK